jgi:hypothetical protein
MLCSADANGSHQGNNPFQFGGMTPNIWIEKNLQELLMASQTGTILILFKAVEDVPSLCTPAINCSQVS